MTFKNNLLVLVFSFVYLCFSIFITSIVGVIIISDEYNFTYKVLNVIPMFLSSCLIWALFIDFTKNNNIIKTHTNKIFFINILFSLLIVTLLLNNQKFKDYLVKKEYDTVKHQLISANELTKNMDFFKEFEKQEYILDVNEIVKYKLNLKSFKSIDKNNYDKIVYIIGKTENKDIVKKFESINSDQYITIKEIKEFKTYIDDLYEKDKNNIEVKFIKDLINKETK